VVLDLVPAYHRARLERALNISIASAIGVGAEAVDELAHDVELQPVVVRVGVLLTDSHRARRGDPRPERRLVERWPPPPSTTWYGSAAASMPRRRRP